MLGSISRSQIKVLKWLGLGLREDQSGERGENEVVEIVRRNLSASNDGVAASVARRPTFECARDEIKSRPQPLLAITEFLEYFPQSLPLPQLNLSAETGVRMKPEMCEIRPEMLRRKIKGPTRKNFRSWA